MDDKKQRPATKEEAEAVRRIYHLPDTCEVVIDPNLTENDGPFFLSEVVKDEQ